MLPVLAQAHTKVYQIKCNLHIQHYRKKMIKKLKGNQ